MFGLFGTTEFIHIPRLIYYGDSIHWAAIHCSCEPWSSSTSFCLPDCLFGLRDRILQRLPPTDRPSDDGRPLNDSGQGERGLSVEEALLLSSPPLLELQDTVGWSG